MKHWKENKRTYNNGKYGDVVHDMWCPFCKKITTFTEYLTAPGGYLDGVICDSCGKDVMEYNIDDLHVYKEKCKCGNEVIALTQDDRSPEYYTDVGIVCECGEIVTFSLPVN